MQIQAPLELSSLIKHYLFLEIFGINNYSLFANGNCGLVFSSNNITYQVESEKVKADTIIFGQITNYLSLHIPEKTHFFVIVLQPYGLNKLTQIPAKEFKDKVINADDIFKNQLDPVKEIINNSITKSQLISSVNTHFYNTYLQKINHENLIPSLVKHIITSQGNLSIEYIRENYCIHERKLQRLFSEHVGLSPKKFLQIAKLHAFIGYLNKYKKLTDAVYEAGYYDQSHLIKDFKAITGMTPSKYKKANTLTINLVEQD